MLRLHRRESEVKDMSDSRSVSFFFYQNFVITRINSLTKALMEVKYKYKQTK